MKYFRNIYRTGQHFYESNHRRVKRQHDHASQVAKWIGIPEDVVRNLTQYPIDGVPQTVKVGPVGKGLPVFFACGTDDSSDLCSGAAGDYFEEGTRALVSNLTYMRMTSPCGHNVLGCSDVVQVNQLIARIVANVKSAAV